MNPNTGNGHRRDWSFPALMCNERLEVLVKRWETQTTCCFAESRADVCPHNSCRGGQRGAAAQCISRHDNYTPTSHHHSHPDAYSRHWTQDSAQSDTDSIGGLLNTYLTESEEFVN